MSFQAANFATTVAAEFALLAWDDAMLAQESVEQVKAAKRVQIEELAETLIEWKDSSGDWKSAVEAQEDAVVKAAAILGIEIFMWNSAYDCPRRWTWEVC